MAQIRHLQRDVARHARYFQKLADRCSRKRFSRLDPLLTALTQACDGCEELLRQLSICEQRIKLRDVETETPY